MCQLAFVSQLALRTLFSRDLQSCEQMRLLFRTERREAGVAPFWSRI